MFKIPTLEPKKQKRSHFLEGELIHLVDKAKYVWLIVGQLPIKAGWWNASLALRDFSRSNKHEDSHRIPTLISRIPNIPTPIPRIPTLILRVPTLIPLIPTLIPHVPTLTPLVPIIPLIPFPDSPFRLLQIAVGRLR